MGSKAKNDFMRNKLMMRPDLEETKKKLAETPDDPDLWYELGKALSNAGESEASVDAYSKGLTLAPFDPYLYFARGCRLSTLGHFWSAIADLTFSIHLEDIWLFHYYRATTYNLHGMYEESCEDFKACVRLAENWECCPMVHWLFTTYLLELKDKKRAVEALSLIPDDIVPPQMDYGYHRCVMLYKGLISPDAFIDIKDMQEKCLKQKNRINLELNTMYYGLFAYSVYTGDEARAKKALEELMKIAVPNAFGYSKGCKYAKEYGVSV